MELVPNPNGIFVQKKKSNQIDIGHNVANYFYDINYMHQYNYR